MCILQYLALRIKEVFLKVKNCLSVLEGQRNLSQLRHLKMNFAAPDQDGLERLYGSIAHPLLELPLRFK